MRSILSHGALITLAIACEGAYYALATRWGLWAAEPGDLSFLWVYGAAIFLYMAACLIIWVTRTDGRAALVIILGFAVLFRLTQLTEPPMAYADTYRYVWDGRVLAAGINPYLYPPSAPQLASLSFPRQQENPGKDLSIPELSQMNSPDVVTPYPPLAEGIFAILYWLWPGNLLAMKATFVVFDLATIALLVALLRHFQRAPTRSIVYAWSPLPIVEFAGHGHLDAVWLPLLLAALLLTLRRRPAWSGFGLALATLVKAVPILLVPVLLRRWGWRGLVPYSLAVALGALPFLGAGSSFMGGVVAMADRWEANASLYYWTMKLNESWRLVEDPGRFVRLSAGMLVLAFTLSLAARRPGGDRSLVAACFWVLAISLLVSTTVFPWYVTWILPLLTLLLADGVSDRNWPAYLGWWLFTCAVGIFYLQFLTDSWPERIGIVEYLPAYGGTAWAAILLWKRRSPKEAASTPVKSSGHCSDLRVGVVIPTLNEEEAIALVIASIPQGLAHDVVVVDGGSRDRTVELALAAGARIIHEARRGYGQACATGAAALRQADIVVFLDGDLSDYPEEMARLVEPIAAGDADLVVGSRLRGQREPGALPLHSLVGNWLAALLMRLLYGLRITDLGPFRAIRRDSLEGLEMTEMTYGWPVEMLGKAARRGLRVGEVPVGYRRRRGRSKITGTLRGSLLASYYILSRIFRYLPNRPSFGRTR